MHEVTIIFKSGAKTRFWANTVNVQRNGFGITNLAWDCEDHDLYPLHLNVDNIDAIMINDKEETTHGK